MKKYLLYFALILIISLLGFCFSQGAGSLGGGSGTITQLDQWRATTSPFSAITTNITGKDLYIPSSSGTSSKWTAGTFCLTGDSCITTWPAGSSTAYTAGGTLLQLIGTQFSLKEGTLTNGKICTYVTGTGLVCDYTDQVGSGGGATTTINGYSGPAFTFATSSDTNIGLNITGSGSTITFTPTWIGTLADGRIASASNWNTAYTDRLKWDGGATGLVAATGRTSLGLGTMALEANTGSTTITTLGTIGTGVWNASPILSAYIASSTEWTAKANYAFGSNNFSGTGNFSTTGIVSATSSVFTNATTSNFAVTGMGPTTIAGALGLGLGAASTTHALTFPSGSTGLALYNTADEFTNYERTTFGYAGNVFTIDSDSGGGGTARTLRLKQGASSEVNLDLSANSSLTQGFLSVNRGTSASNNIHFSTNGTMGNSSGINIGIAMLNAYNQSGSAGYTGLQIKPTETALGSGTHYLIQAGTSTNNNLFTVDNLGNSTTTGTAYIGSILRLGGGLRDSNNATGTSGQILSSTGTATKWIPNYWGIGSNFIYPATTTDYVKAAYFVGTSTGTTFVDLTLTKWLKDSTNATGTIGQSLFSTGTSTRWTTNSELNTNDYTGSDIGAKVMAAYNSVNVPVITIRIAATSTTATTTYAFSTAMNFDTFNKHVKLICDPRVVLDYTGSATSTILNTGSGSQGATDTSDQGVFGCNYIKTGARTGTAISVGGSNGFSHGHVENNYVTGFALGFYSEAHSYLYTAEGNHLAGNIQNVHIVTQNDSGEQIRFLNNDISDCLNSDGSSNPNNCFYAEDDAMINSTLEGNSFDDANVYIGEGNSVTFLSNYWENPNYAATGKYTYLSAVPGGYGYSNINIIGGGMASGADVTNQPTNYITCGTVLNIDGVRFQSFNGNPSNVAVYEDGNCHLTVKSFININNNAYTTFTTSTNVTFFEDPMNNTVGIGTSTLNTTQLSVQGTTGQTIFALFSNAGTKFMEMLNTGITTLLGVWDFGGATSLEVPNGTGNTVDTTGEIALDTTSNQLLLADSGGTARVYGDDDPPLFAVTIASTSAAFHSGGLLPIAKNTRYGRDITVYKCHVVSGTSVVIDVTDGTNDTETITCGTTQTTDTDVATNSTFTADEFWSLEFGTVTGTPDYLVFEAYGYITRE